MYNVKQLFTICFIIFALPVLADEVNVSSLSDEIICDKAPHVDFYPELKVFYDEAKVRGLDCIENVVPLEVGKKVVKVQSDFKPKKICRMNEPVTPYNSRLGFIFAASDLSPEEKKQSLDTLTLINNLAHESYTNTVIKLIRQSYFSGVEPFYYFGCAMNVDIFEYEICPCIKQHNLVSDVPEEFIDEFCEMEWARQVRILTEQDVLLNDYLVKLDL